MTDVPIAITGSRRATPSGRLTGWLGAAVLVLMLLGCLVTLPYTLGRANADASASADVAPVTQPRRFAATNLDHALLPPFWARHAADERERVEAGDGDRPRHMTEVFGAIERKLGA